ncbi:Exocyst complex component EXO70H1 [Linum grandiflorum]
MPRKGMRSICFSPRTLSFAAAPNNSPLSSPARSSISGLSTPRLTFSDYRTEQIIESASALITKWDPETSPYAKVTSLFYESKREAAQFLKSLTDLQKAMRLLSAEDPKDSRLIRAQNLMQIGMKRLQKEFYQILSTNRAHLDPESISTRSSTTSARSSLSDYDGDDGVAGSDSIAEVEEVSSIAMGDLRTIAECMISSGYAKECVSIYKVIRKSIVDEGIYRLGVEKFGSVSKMSWESVELRVKAWLEAVKVAVRTLFNGERILCDHVFAAFDSVRESCFADISKDGAALLFGFPELVAKKAAKKTTSPDMIFRLLDMYAAVSENWMEIESIFSFESTSAVRSQAINSLTRLGESIRGKLSEFESTVQKDSSKSMVPGSGVHPLTFYTADYLSLLSDYSSILADILQDWHPPPRSPLTGSFFDSPKSFSDESQPPPALSTWMSWLIVVLLAKLDVKAKQYKEVSLSYLFLANNLRHVVTKVRTSNMQFLLGEEWIAKHEGKVRQFAANYERLAWEPVAEAITASSADTMVSAEKAREVFKRFGERFEEAYRKQSSCIVDDPKLRNEIKRSIARKVVPRYWAFYDANKATVGAHRNVRIYVKYTPEDVGKYLSELFFEAVVEEESTRPSPSSTSSSSHNRRMRV